ncbi:nucleotidyltransferase domain-containing protein [Pedobacter sp. SJ11]|uniref:Nucleotidyltransferase domain-containing protein n=1 Tax=Pedobacter rhodius TaxID=3004098 RepID=A0ABT4L252_9SPHI|nr:nucleotidyltransferase domain-containing protein [Pedobacter sp. SJ11]
MPQIITLLKKHEVTSAFLFGSAVSDRFNEGSDVDFLINLKEDLEPLDAGEHLWDLQDELRDLLNREVDLLTERSLKNPYFIQELSETKVAIYG